MFCLPLRGLQQFEFLFTPSVSLLKPETNKIFTVGFVRKHDDGDDGNDVHLLVAMAV